MCERAAGQSDRRRRRTVDTIQQPATTIPTGGLELTAGSFATGPTGEKQVINEGNISRTKLL